MTVKGILKFLLKLIVTLGALCILGIICIRTRFLLEEQIVYLRQKESVTAGKIVEKKTEKGELRLFKFGEFKPVRYFFVVEWYYEKDEEMIVETKDFEVECDVYLAYNVGDYYDSQNFKVASETEIANENEIKES